MHVLDTRFRHAFIAEHLRDEHGLAAAAEQADVARVALDRFAQARRVELVTASRDDDERVPSDGKRAERVDHVHADHVDARSESLARRELGPVVDHRDLVVEHRGHLRDRETDVTATRDHEARLREHRLHEQLVLLIEHDGAGTSLTQRIERGFARGTVVDRK